MVNKLNQILTSDDGDISASYSLVSSSSP